jgi:hypothetical protein
MPTGGEPRRTPASRVRSFEFLGLPGAGKTTLASEVAEQLDVVTVEQLVLQQRLRKVRKRPRQRIAMRLLPTSLKLRLLDGPMPEAKDAAAFVHAHRGFHDAVLRACDEVPDEANRDLALQLLFETWAEYRFAERVGQPGTTLLFHEGILQRLVFLMALVPPGRDQLLTTLLDEARFPDGVVLLDVPLDVAVERVGARTRGFRMTELMARMSDHIDMVSDRLGSLGVPSTVVRSDASQELALPPVVAFVRDQLGVGQQHARAITATDVAADPRT